MANMARTMLVAPCFAYARELAETAVSLQAVGAPGEIATALATEVATAAGELVTAIAELEASNESKNRIEAMGKVREAADCLEHLVPGDTWPLPSYADMMFLQ
jgi:glutamine synthetase